MCENLKDILAGVRASVEEAYETVLTQLADILGACSDNRLYLLENDDVLKICGIPASETLPNISHVPLGKSDKTNYEIFRIRMLARRFFYIAGSVIQNFSAYREIADKNSVKNLNPAIKHLNSWKTHCSIYLSRPLDDQDELADSLLSSSSKNDVINIHALSNALIEKSQTCVDPLPSQLAFTLSINEGFRESYPKLYDGLVDCLIYTLKTYIRKNGRLKQFADPATAWWLLNLAVKLKDQMKGDDYKNIVLPRVNGMSKQKRSEKPEDKYLHKEITWDFYSEARTKLFCAKNAFQIMMSLREQKASYQEIETVIQELMDFTKDCADEGFSKDQTENAYFASIRVEVLQALLNESKDSPSQSTLAGRVQ